MYKDATLNDLEGQLIGLQVMAVDLPTHLHTTLHGFAGEVRGQYHLVLIGNVDHQPRWRRCFSLSLCSSFTAGSSDRWTY